MLEPGDRIGDWIVDRTLGEGGMGAVYACHNTLSERIRAAVKVLKPHDLGDSRRRFIREIELLASIQHPAVVRVLGGGEDPERGLLWMAMELLDGEPLDARLARGPLSWDEASRIFQELGAGLLLAHRMGVVHRDIKPQNIMICADGHAKLLDFGIAVQQGATRLTRQGLVPGTLAYLPPEVFGGQKPDHRADIYALGQVLWETLTGQQAFPEDPDSSPGQSVARLMGRKMASDALELGTAAPGPVRDLVRRCTEPEPEDRLDDLDAFITTLRDSGGHALPAGYSPPPPTPEVPASTATFDWVEDPDPPEEEEPRLTRSEPTQPLLEASKPSMPEPRRSWAPVLAIGLGLMLLAVIAVAAVVGIGGFLWLSTGTPTSTSSTVILGAMPQGQVPDGFPFEISDDARILSGTRSEADGQVALNVTYLTDDDPKAVIDGYTAAFKARGLTLSSTNTTAAEGTTWAVTGYLIGGETATASAGPYPSFDGNLVTVSWVPAPPR
ncbi:MAG: serine/threonine protein kinase [Alphaproteobacteria bacterium]|nr:serine/threonine protein kinase [Alphaproteobacteria bacterium]